MINFCTLDLWLYSMLENICAPDLEENVVILHDIFYMLSESFQFQIFKKNLMFYLWCVQLQQNGGISYFYSHNILYRS